MKITPDLAAVAALIADPSRATMLGVLLGGIALPAGELARQAGITPQTASTHLTKLVEGGLLAVKTSGRHRYFQLSSPQVAQALEALCVVAPAPKVRTLSQSLEIQAVRRARTCYNHLAGQLGVILSQHLVEQKFLVFHQEAYEVSSAGQVWFEGLGIKCDQAQSRRPNFAKACLDWSERKPHLAGTLGSALAQRLFELEWLTRYEKSRAVKVTPLGITQLRAQLSMTWTPNLS